MIRIIALSVLTIFLSVNAYADVEFVMESIQAGNEQPGKIDSKTKGNNFRMDFYENGQNLEGSMIYNGDRKEMMMLDHKQKVYTVLDQESMTAIGNQLQSAMKEMEAAMKDMSPEQREAMEKMMKGNIPGMGEEYVEPVLKKSGSAKVNKYSCTNYDVYKGEEKTREICVADWGQIEGGDEMQTVMTEMSEFLKQMSEAFSSMPGSQARFEENIFNQLKKLGGFPVQTISFKNGEEVSKSALVSSKKTDVSAALMEPPADYKRQNMDMR